MCLVVECSCQLHIATWFTLHLELVTQLTVASIFLYYLLCMCGNIVLYMAVWQSGSKVWKHVGMGMCVY